MAFNGSDLVTEPFNTTFSPYTDLFDYMLDGTGAMFFLVPLIFISIALFVKTRDITVVGMFMLVSGGLASGTTLFVGALDASLVFTVFAAIGITALFVSFLLKR